MKKIIISISDFTFEKIKFEALEQKKCVQQIIEERFLHKPFSYEVEEAFEKKMSEELSKILED